MNPLVSIPSASQMLTDVGSSSAPVFTATYPIAIVAVGFFVGAMIILFLKDAIIGAFINMAHGRNKFHGTPGDPGY